MLVRTLLFVGTVLLLPVVGKAEPRGKQRKVTEEAPPTMKAQALRDGGPDVIFVIAEGLGADDLNAADLAATAPELHKWINLGTRYSQAYYPTINDGPARTALLTGIPPWDSGVTDDSLDWQKAAALKEKASLPDYLRQGGFLTAGGGKIFAVNPEIAADASQLREHLQKEGVWDERFASDENDAAERNQKVLEWAETFLAKKRELPYFLMIALEQESSNTESIKHVNELCKGVLQKLEEADTLKKTILILVGTPAKDQKLTTSKSVALSLYVPDKTQPSSTNETLVSVLNVYPTLCETVGDLKTPKYIKGSNLLKTSSGSAEVEPLVFTKGKGNSAIAVIRSDKWLYERTASGEEHLYDLTTDAELKKDLAADASQDPIKQKFKARVPKTWTAFSRAMEDVIYDSSADGTIVYELQSGDTFKASEGPDLQGRGIDIQIIFNYRANQDENATLLSVGDRKTGFAVHAVKGEPCFTINYEGLSSTLRIDKKLPNGQVVLHGLLGLDGSLSLAAVGVGDAHGYAPMEGGFTKPLNGIFTVGQQGPVLPADKFKDQTDLRGSIKFCAFGLLPGTTAESRAVKAVPVE